ncbi:hypothetical protein SGLAM104S_09788 [Streptomyces glaucescens]
MPLRSRCRGWRRSPRQRAGPAGCRCVALPLGSSSVWDSAHRSVPPRTSGKSCRHAGPHCSKWPCRSCQAHGLLRGGLDGVPPGDQVLGCAIPTDLAEAKGRRRRICRCRAALRVPARGTAAYGRCLTRSTIPQSTTCDSWMYFFSPRSRDPLVTEAQEFVRCRVEDQVLGFVGPAPGMGDPHPGPPGGVLHSRDRPDAGHKGQRLVRRGAQSPGQHRVLQELAEQPVGLVPIERVEIADRPVVGPGAVGDDGQDELLRGPGAASSARSTSGGGHTPPPFPAGSSHISRPSSMVKEGLETSTESHISVRRCRS